MLTDKELLAVISAGEPWPGTRTVRSIIRAVERASLNKSEARFYPVLSLALEALQKEKQMRGSGFSMLTLRAIEAIEALHRELHEEEGEQPPAEPVKPTPEIPELLYDAWEYGQFADDFDVPLIRPVRRAIREMLEANPRKGYHCG